MDRRPPNLWFILSWVLLVVVISAGFFIQARTIQRLEDDEQAIEEAIAVRDAGQVQLCGVLVALAPEFDERIVMAFATAGIECPQVP